MLDSKHYQNCIQFSSIIIVLDSVVVVLFIFLANLTLLNSTTSQSQLKLTSIHYSRQQQKNSLDNWFIFLVIWTTGSQNKTNPLSQLESVAQCDDLKIRGFQLTHVYMLYIIIIIYDMILACIIPPSPMILLP